MAVYRDKRGGKIQWRYRVLVTLPDGSKQRISGKPAINTKKDAEDAERAHIRRALAGEKAPVPTLKAFFDESYCKVHVEAAENREGTKAEKRSAFKHHISPELGDLQLDKIDVAAVEQFKADLKKKKSARTGAPLSAKTRNNILGVLSNVLRYAEDIKVIQQAPRVKLARVERPEIDCLEFEEYARVVAAAKADGAAWHAAVLLAGEAGLRIGEVLALRWEHLDLVAGTVTVARQVRQGVEGLTKGGRTRKVPMTALLQDTLEALPQVRRGRVIVQEDGTPMPEARAKPHGIHRVYRLAGLSERGWHALRHTFATHLAQLGVNSWRLQAWLGHTTIAQTMRYLHHAEAHRRPVPLEVLAAAAGIADPDERIIAMLGARAGADYSADARANGLPTTAARQHNTASSNASSVHATGFEPGPRHPRSRR